MSVIFILKSRQNHLKTSFKNEWKQRILSSVLLERGSTTMRCNFYNMCFLLLSLCFFSLLIIGCNPPNLHRDGFDGVRDSILSPGVPHYVRPLPRVQLCVFGRAVEVCQAALVEPPSRPVVPDAAAFHREVADGAGGITAVIVHVRGAERSRVLVLILVVAAKGVTWKRTERLTGVHTYTGWLWTYSKCVYHYFFFLPV